MSSVKFTLLKAGHCFHPEAVVVKGAKWKACELPALCGLLEHPQFGPILYDTGYSSHFFTETRPFPYRFYAWVTPSYLEKTLLAQLEERGFQASDIRYILISHFHADHMSGLKDFPNATFICFKSGLDSFRSRRGISAVIKGYIPNLLPTDFEKRVLFLDDLPRIPVHSMLAPFEEGYDIFGDQSLVAINLPGHAYGQTGLLFSDTSGQTHFLVADACWDSRNYQEFRPPIWPAYLIFSNKKEYLQTLLKIREVWQKNTSLSIVPSHCIATWKKMNGISP